MNYHRDCPGCGERVSPLQLILAPTPLRFRCAQCKAPITVHMPGLFVLTMLTLAVVMGLGYALVQILLADGFNTFLSYLGLTIFIWLALELGIALLVINNAELEVPDHFRKKRDQMP